MFVFEGDAVGDEGARCCISDAYVYHGCDFPELNEDTHALAEEDHPTGILIIVQ